jgi:hypothetical protein
MAQMAQTVQTVQMAQTVLRQQSLSEQQPPALLAVLPP